MKDSSADKSVYKETGFRQIFPAFSLISILVYQIFLPFFSLYHKFGQRFNFYDKERAAVFNSIYSGQ